MTDESAGQPTPIVVRPDHGMKRFRRNASLALESGCLVATDRHGRSARFPLSGPDAPARFELLLNRGEYILIDGRGQTLLSTDLVYWDVVEKHELFDAAGIPQGARSVPPDPAPLRPDGIRLDDATWPKWIAYLAPGGLPVGMLAANDIIPIPLAIPYFVVVFGGAIAAWLGGYWSKPRHGKDWDNYQAFLAKGRERKAAAAEERKRRR